MEERAALVKWLDTKLNSIDWSSIKHAGHVTIPRLNKTEYNNTMRDLLGVDIKPGNLFSDDGEGQSGFTTDRDNLFLSAALMEKYFTAAENALDALMKDVEPIDLQIEAEDMFVTESGIKPENYGSFIGQHLRIGQITVYDSVEFPMDGMYTLQLRGMCVDGSVAKAVLRIDNELKGEFLFNGNTPEVQQKSIFITQGTHQVAWNMGKVPTLEKVKNVKFARTPAIDWMKFTGPELKEKNKKLVFHTLPNETISADRAAHRIISRFVQRAARRPVSGTIVNRYFDIYQNATDQGSNFDDSIKLALTAVLVSPRFLYRHEFTPTDNHEGDYALDSYQLASRLSYFLWMSMPDDELFTLAAEDKLREPDILRAQVRRMIIDPKFRAFSSAFLGQWLGIESIGRDVVPDHKIFPEFNESLNEAMKTETIMTFEHLIRKGNSLLSLLDTKGTYLNEELATHYGISGIKGDHMRPTTLTNQNRGGLLGMASVLTATSSPTRTSPVLRGKWVMETLLGGHIPEPPADIPDLPATAGLDQKMTLRQELEAHRNKEECASCHDEIDPIGFGLENFDAIGRYRTSEVMGQPIDSSGELDGFKFSGAAELKAWLIKERKEPFIRNLTERMLAFSLGREIQTFDEAAILKITSALQQNNYSAATLIEETVLSYPFTHQSNSNEIKEHE